MATTVAATDFQKNIGRWMDHARTEPVTITRHGRPILVLQAASGAAMPAVTAAVPFERPEESNADRARYVQVVQDQLRGDPRSSVNFVNELLARRRAKDGE